jgi:hypothetical protein
MIDPATGWLEIKEQTNKEAITTANIVEQTWLTHYPIPQLLTYDRGTYFMAEFAEMIEMTMVSKEKVLQSKTHKQMKYWKECINIIWTFSKETWMKKIHWEAF